PWLSPAPHRGQRNESARIPLIRDCVAATLGITPEEVEAATDHSAARLFGFGTADTP
ncbi:MAG: TatD family hydrolase, partial [Muribaculaceae bacterium]|nr:TatD family hydrolase [Muribaculaceae bacterium]